MSHELAVFLKLPTVIGVSQKSRSSIMAGVKDGTFPAPVKVGSRSVAWTAESIAKWQESCISSAARA